MIFVRALWLHGLRVTLTAIKGRSVVGAARGAMWSSGMILGALRFALRGRKADPL
jgi:hypothetical protein